MRKQRWRVGVTRRNTRMKMKTRLTPGRTLSSKVREGRGRQAKDTSPEKNIKKSGLRDEKRSDESK